MLTILLDADIIIYRTAIKFEHKWEENGHIERVTDEQGAIRSLEEYCHYLKQHLKADDLISCLSASSNWRSALYADYKGNRKSEKPLLYHALRQHVISNMKKCMRPALEADDVMGILATHDTLVPGDKMVVSSDKDLQTVPCWLYNPNKDQQPREITVEAAHRFHMMQTLMGDATDNYKGCPGVGPKRADIFLNAVDPKDYWFAVCHTYACYGSDEATALCNARLAKILTSDDYDFAQKKVRLWAP